MGDGYGPMVVAREPMPSSTISNGKTIAVPGTLTSAFLALRLCLGQDFEHVVVPFDEIIEAVSAASTTGKRIDAGLIIHEGQLTYAHSQLKLIVDLGVWWKELTGLPLPLGANAIRKDLGDAAIRDVQRLLLRKHQVRPRPSAGSARARPAVRPRPRPQPGRQVRRHVRQRLDARLRRRAAARP